MEHLGITDFFLRTWLCGKETIILQKAQYPTNKVFDVCMGRKSGRLPVLILVRPKKFVSSSSLCIKHLHFSGRHHRTRIYRALLLYRVVYHYNIIIEINC